MARGRGRKPGVGPGRGVSVGDALPKRQHTKRKRTANRSGELSPTQQSTEFVEAYAGPEQGPQASSPKEQVVFSSSNHPEEQLTTPPITQPRIQPCNPSESTDTRSKQVTNPEVLRFSDEETEDENAADESNHIGRAERVLLGQDSPPAVEIACIKGLSSTACVSDETVVDSAGFNHYAMHKSSSAISDDMLGNCDEEPITSADFHEEAEPNIIDVAEEDPCLGRHFLHKENRLGFGLLDQQFTCPELSSQNIPTQPICTLGDAMFSEDGTLVQMPSDSQDCRSRGLPLQPGTSVTGINNHLSSCSSGQDTEAHTSSAKPNGTLQPGSQERVQLAEITNVVPKPTKVPRTVYRRRNSNKGSLLQDGVSRTTCNNDETDNAMPRGLHAIFGGIFGSLDTQSSRSLATAHGSANPSIVGGLEVPALTIPFPIRHGVGGRGPAGRAIVCDSQDLRNLPLGLARPAGVIRRPTAARSTCIAQTVQLSGPNINLPQSGTCSMRHKNSGDRPPTAFEVLPRQRTATHQSTTEPLMELLRSQATTLPRTKEGQQPIFSHCENNTPAIGRGNSRAIDAEANTHIVSQEASGTLDTPRATRIALGGLAQSTGGRGRSQPRIPGGRGRGQTCPPEGRGCGQPSTPIGRTELSTAPMGTQHTNAKNTSSMCAPFAAIDVLSSMIGGPQSQNTPAPPTVVDSGNHLEAAPIAANATSNQSTEPNTRRRQTRRPSQRGPPVVKRGTRQQSEVGVTGKGSTGDAAAQQTHSIRTVGAIGPIPDVSCQACPTENVVEMQGTATGESSEPAEPIPNTPIDSGADKAIERNKGKLRKRAYRARRKAEAAGVPPPGGAAVSMNARVTLSLCHGEPRDPWHDVLKKQLTVIIPLHVLCYRPMPSITLEEHEAIYKALIGRYSNGDHLSPRWTKRQVSQLTQQRRTATRRKVKVALADAAESGGNPKLPAGVFQGEMDFFIAQLADENFLKYSGDMSQKSINMLVVRGYANPMGQRGVSARKALHVGVNGDAPATIRDVLAWKEAAYNTYLNDNSKTAVARRLLNPTPASSSTQGTFIEETGVQAAHLHEGMEAALGPLSLDVPLDPDWHDPFMGPAAYRREYVLLYGREPTKADLTEWDASGRPPLH